jgi:hypothetical protein
MFEDNEFTECLIDNIEDHYWLMPEFHPKTCTACFKELEVRIRTRDDLHKLNTITGLGLTDKSKSSFYPAKPKMDYSKIRAVSSDLNRTTPKYPVYIVSKSRWEKRLTSDSLVNMRVKHYIIVEEHQYQNYLDVVDPEWVTVLILPQKYLDEYDTFDNLGFQKSKGPGAARNFAWEHSIQNGFARHWVMDDNAKDFYFMQDSMRVPVSDGAILRAMEDHSDRYDNVYISGPCYRFFVVPNDKTPNFILNTRIYSCLLIRNDIPYRWRGRYNEDTDLSLRVLKDGHCTIQYTQFLFGKIVTQAMGGGNTEAFYAGEGTTPKSQMLVDMHPDVARFVMKYGRPHHYVNYRQFLRNRLKYKEGVIPVRGYDSYGIEIKEVHCNG